MMAKSLNEAFEELKKEEALKKQKKKPVLEFPKEKRLAYYSGWHKDDFPEPRIQERRGVAEHQLSRCWRH